MARIMIAPGRYVQGAGAMNEVGKHVALFGSKALVIGGKRGLGSVREAMKRSFSENGIEYLEELFGGECCDSEIDRITKLGREKDIDIMVGVGGGKALDTAKAVAEYLKVPVAVIPTIAATDAPCSALAVIYTQDGVFERYFVLPQNPNLVLVDTDIIAKAPSRFLVSGMGDALATWFEAEACSLTKAPNMPGGEGTSAALSLAKLCYEILLEYGMDAKIACEAHAITPALEKVVEANTLLSGLGFESSGLAAAHAVHDGLTVLEETHKFYHGEKVSFGTLTQLVLQDMDPDTIYEVLDFACSIGLPVTLRQLGLKEVSYEKLLPAAKAACAEGTTMANMPFKVTPEMVVNAMLGADALGRAFLEE
jgi:glycerol dehydrogenase